jgi:low temperature requirement protein LtrA
LHDNPTAEGLVVFAALFIPVWWSWMGYTWYATSFPERGLVNRFGALAGMLGVLAMAAQVETASAGDPRGMLVAFVVLHLIVALLFFRAARLFPEREKFAMRYTVGLILAAAVWLGSLALPPHLRSWVWAAALLIELATPVAAVRASSGVTFDASHIPERYGLFTIIVLGEALIAVARGTAEAHWTASAVAAAVAGFVIAVVIWWAYFAHEQTALLLRDRVGAFVWGYGHLFVWTGIAITGVGIELAIQAAEDEHTFASGERLILCGGSALYLAAMALLRAATAGSLRDPVALGRLATAALIVVLGVVGTALSPAALTIAVAAVAVGAWFVIRLAWQRVSGG